MSQSDDNIQAKFDQKVFAEAIMGEMKRFMTRELKQLHERMDKLVSESVEHSEHVSQPQRRRTQLREPRVEEDRNQKNNNISGNTMKFPLFQGKDDPDAYLKWEKKVELIFGCHNYSERKKVRCAVFSFLDYANVWWGQFETKRRRNKEEPIEIWDEMKAVMRGRFLPPSHTPTPTPMPVPIPPPLVLLPPTLVLQTTPIVDITPLDPSPLIVSPIPSSPPQSPQSLPMIQVLPPSLPTHYMEPIEDEVMYVPIVFSSDEKFIEIIEDGVVLHFPVEEEKPYWVVLLEWHYDECREVDIFMFNNFVPLRWDQMKRVKMKTIIILLDLRTNPFQEEGNDANQGAISKDLVLGLFMAGKLPKAITFSPFGVT